MPPYPATRAEISSSHLIGNFSRLRSLAQQAAAGERCDLLAVVKANAYGNGISLCAPWLAEAGAQWLGVTNVEEGVLVRQLCPNARILVMSGLHASEAAALLDANLVPTVWTPDHLQTLAQIANQRSLAPGSIPIHLEIDTGMSRQGVSFAAAELTPILNQLRTIPALRLDGVFTHFSAPEVLNAEQNPQQITRFQQSMEQVAAAEFHPQWIHAGNSSTLLAQRQMQPLLSLAKAINATLLLRPGIALYGYALPFSGDSNTTMPIELDPVLAWKTATASIRTVPAGTRVGYNGTFIAPGEMRLALLPVGYADGLNRKLSNRGHVLIRGIAAPIIGRVSMDLTIVDITHIPAATVGDQVVILGEQNGRRITADDHARWAETISYEILCAVGARVPRVACE
jgi:alanine racemase